MADHPLGTGPTGNDPLGDRMRSTFAAERAHVEQRLLATEGSSKPSRPLRWVPLAAAASVIAIAGFLFIGNRTNDTAVDLEVTAQPADGQGEGSDGTGDGTSNESELVVATPAVPLPPDAPLVVPFVTGERFCASPFDPSLNIVWRADASNSPALVEPGYGVGVTRQILSGTRIDLAGGCTAGMTAAGYGEWHEIRSVTGASNEWILREHLITEAAFQAWLRDGTMPPPPAPTPELAAPVPVPSAPPVPITQGPGAGDCGFLPAPAIFVWDIDVDDPDGGLVAHTSPGIDAPVTRILKLDEVVHHTGSCQRSSSGSLWHELIQADGTTDWASGRYLNPDIAPACLQGEQLGGVTRDATPSEQIFGPVEGLAIVDGDLTAFAPFGEDRYRWYYTSAIQIGQGCFGSIEAGPGCAYGNIVLDDPMSPEPLWTGSGPREIQLTGVTLPGPASDSAKYEVVLDIDGVFYVGYIDSFDTRIERWMCAGDASGGDSFADLPCTAEPDSFARGYSRPPSFASASTLVIGIDATTLPTADGQDCTRVVLTLGLATDAGGLVAANTVPELLVEHSLEWTKIYMTSWEAFTPEQESTIFENDNVRVDVTRTGDAPPTIEIQHETQPNVFFMENPARIVVDHIEMP